MRFARDIRQQLERIIGPDGSGFESGSGRQRAERPRGSEGGEAGGSGEAARRDEQPAAEGRQREGERERERDGGKRDRERERERERHCDSRGGKRPRRSSTGGFCDAATVSALRMALTIGALRWGVGLRTQLFEHRNSEAGQAAVGCLFDAGCVALSTLCVHFVECRRPSLISLKRQSLHSIPRRLCQPDGTAHAHAQRVSHSGRVVHPCAGESMPHVASRCHSMQLTVAWGLCSSQSHVVVQVNGRIHCIEAQLSRACVCNHKPLPTAASAPPVCSAAAPQLRPRGSRRRRPAA